jgi:AcrR family transcriptional regulator
MENIVAKDEKTRIIEFSANKFFTEGFHKTTIDEIARELAVSKNTIYKYFPTKEKLISSTIEHTIKNVALLINPVLDSNENALVKLVKMLEIVSNNVMKFSDKWMRDLQLHMPELWEKIDELRKNLMYKNFSKIVRQGQKEKLFKDYPAELIITAYMAALRSVVNPAFLLNSKFTVREAAHHTFEILLNGILTEKGISVFKTIKLPI